ncbi:MAG: hypothetical protein ACXW61_02850 [Gemmatirosa sp.]
MLLARDGGPAAVMAAAHMGPHGDEAAAIDDEAMTDTCGAWPAT